MAAYQEIQKKFDFPYSLKPEQKECIHKLVNGLNTVAILPTGYGKSDIFALQPLVSEFLQKEQKFSIVVVPLISLVDDIAKKYRDRGLEVLIFKGNGDIPSLFSYTYSMVITTPESLIQLMANSIVTDEGFVHRLSCIAIDEAHVIIQW